LKDVQCNVAVFTVVLSKGTVNMANYTGKGYFQKGNKVAKGRGRLQIIDVVKTDLTQLFLDRAEEGWPELIKHTFEEAYRNTKVLLFVMENLLVKPTQIVSMEQEVPELKNEEDVKLLGPEKLKEIADFIQRQSEMLEEMENE
jgi:hypothetical protein